MAADSNQVRFTQGMDRTLGSIPAGPARANVRIADSGDIGDLLALIRGLEKTVLAAHEVTRAHLINTNQAAEDVTRQFLADRIKDGAKPSDVAASVIAAMGKDLAREVANDLINRLKE